MTGYLPAWDIEAKRERDRESTRRSRARKRGDDTTAITGTRRARSVLPKSAETDTSWRKLAACRTADPRLFDAEREADAQAAIKICGGCEVRARCALTAALIKVESGVWGGVNLGVAQQAVAS